MPERPDVLFPAEPWTVSETAFSPDTNYRNETTFALSNGYIGTRGTQDECMPFDVDTGLEGNYINGFYESETVRYGEWNFGFPTQSQSLLNLPNPKQIVPIVDGEKLDLRTASLRDYRRQLDMREGVLNRSFIWITQQGKQIEVRSERFCSLDNQNLLAMRYEMIPLNFSGEITLCSALEADVENHTRKTNPLIDYGPFGRRIEPESMTAEPFRLFYQGVTQHTKLHMACGVDHQVQGKVVAQTHKAEEMRGELTFVLSAVQGEAIRLIKLIAFASSASAGQLRPFVWNCLDDCACTGYEALRGAHVAHMRQFWDTADVEIDGDEWVQQGIRFNLFHIMQASGRNGRTGLGAKGLTGEGYEGHYFWDTETYIMPVFDYTQPMLSRNLLLYRYHTLPQARERAKVLGHPCGALYPWRTINGEEASTYFPLGTAQYHINGDIANAVWQYVQATDDIAFLRDYGFEMLCEISRVWADVGCFADVRGGQYCICSVTGPDEYNAIVDNNFYTNLLAQENLRQTLQALHLLKQREPAAAEALTAKLGISQEECALWKRVADQMCLPYDEKLGVYVQDDGFLMRKPWDDSFIAPEKRHLLYENFHPLFIYRQRMCKQADAILGMQMFSERFTDEELRRNYDFYQTVTLHHSSLSTSIFGILACRVGYPQQAYEYFQQSARMDLDDCHRNVYAGIHAANMAGTWLNIVQGFAGFRIKEGMPEFSVMLPPQWKGYRFHMLWQGKRLLVDVQESGVDFTLEQGDALTWLYRGEKHKLSRGETIHESL